MTVTTNAPELAETFRRYAELNGRDVPELAQKQALQLVIGSKGYDGLYQFTKQASPDVSQVAADVQRQGWKIPAYFPDGRIGRGEPRMWADFAFTQSRKGRRGRPKKGESREGFRARRPTLRDMQDFVIRRRSNAIGYVATGWLGAARDLGGSLPAGSGEIRSERGRAEIEQEDGYATITLVNNTPGIVYVNQKAQVAKRAIAARVSDMMEYIRRKLAENAAQVWGSRRAA